MSVYCKSYGKKSQIERFVLDSGASHHMTNNAAVLCEYREIPHIQVRHAGTGSISAVGVGKILTGTFTLTDVFYMPELDESLISLRLLTGSGLECNIKGESLILKGKKRQSWKIKSDDDGLFRIELEYQVPIAMRTRLANENRVHRLLGHPARIADELFRRFGVANQNPGFCDVCETAHGESVGFSHRGRGGDRVASTLAFDVAGPMEVPGFLGERYLLVMVHYDTDYTFAFAMKNRSEQTEFIKNIINQCESRDKRITRVVCDNAGENTSEELQSFYAEKGIVARFANPYTSNQNAVAERRIRTVMDRTRGLLMDMEVEARFWSQAAETAALMVNYMINSEGESPYKAWEGVEPEYRYLKIFGCKAAVRIPRNQRGKLGPRAHIGMMAGYSDNGYFIVLPEDKYVWSRDVDFDEESKGQEVITRRPEEPEFTFNYGELSPEDVGEAEATEEDVVARMMDEFMNFDAMDETVASEQPEEHSELNEISFVTAESGEDYSAILEEQRNSQILGETEGQRESGGFLQTVNVRQQVRTKRPGFALASPEQEAVMDSMQERVDAEASNSGIFEGNVLPEGTSRRRASAIRPRTAMAKRLRKEQVVKPENYREMLVNEFSEQWKEGLHSELAAMEKLEVFKIAEKPEGRKLMSTKYVFAVKEGPDGFVDRLKVRMVARGFSQVEGIDYFDTYSSVVSATTIRVVCAVIVKNGLKTRQLDISTAYLNSPLKEELYMKIPEGYQEYLGKDLSGKCLKLKKALPGTKQGAVAWFETCRKYIRNEGLRQVKFEESLFVKGKNIIMLYVDDIVLVGETEEELDRMEKLFRDKFKLTVQGELSTFLKMEFETKNGFLAIGQSKYIMETATEFGIETKRKYKVPMNQKMDFGDPKEIKGRVDGYSSLVGSLLYAQQKTRPDVSFPVHVLAKFGQANERQHYEAGLKVLTYLWSTKEKRLVFERKDSWKMEVYADASFATSEKRKSIGGYVILINGTAVMWRTYGQKFITLSTAESEYVALCDAMKTAFWIGNLLKELGYPIGIPKCYEDNESCIKTIKGSKSPAMIKHLDIKFQWLKYAFLEGNYEMQYVKTKDQVANSLTKIVAGTEYEFFIRKINLRDKERESAHDKPEQIPGEL